MDQFLSENKKGQGAWKALKAYYEGNTMKSRRKQECQQASTRTNYETQTKIWRARKYKVSYGV